LDIEADSTHSSHSPLKELFSRHILSSHTSSLNRTCAQQNEETLYRVKPTSNYCSHLTDVLS